MKSPLKWPFAAILAVVAGCAGRPPTSAPAPPVADARQALTLALDAWKAGKPIGAVEGSSPPVQADDPQWHAGRKLAGYEILSDEEAPGSRVFLVRLDAPTPAAAEEVRYLVMGANPVHVYREDDFRRAASMDDSPVPK